MQNYSLHFSLATLANNYSFIFYTTMKLGGMSRDKVSSAEFLMVGTSTKIVILGRLD